MSNSRYSLHQYSVDTLLNWIRTEEIVIPEIQRPFVWSANKVRDFIDSLYHGYPVGYLITWPKSDISLRGGESSTRERILIDGQQRTMALRAALLGKKVLTKKYREQRIQIAFHPDREEFAVATRAVQRDSSWIPDISTVFNSNSGLIRLVDEYCERNDGVDRYEMGERIGRLYEIRNNSLGVIELSADIDIETVVEIFVRINGTGVRLSAADFIMSKLAASEQYNGHLLRQSIDYFCHLATVPEAYDRLIEDRAFANTDYFRSIEWLKDWSDNVYVPAYTDMLRVVFASKFKRGDLTNLVDLLSGDSAEETFYRLEDSMRSYINETNFKRFVMILRSAGFVDASMLTAKNAVNSAYILFLILRTQNVDASQIEQLVRRWFVMSVLTERYSGEPQATLSEDVRNMSTEEGVEVYLESLGRSGLSDAFWNEEFMQKLNVSGPNNIYFNVFLASQIKANAKGFLSRDITIRDLFEGQKDIHHIFPKNHLRELGIPKKEYNQIANLVVIQRDINIPIGDTAPTVYFSQLQAGCGNGEPPYGGIDNSEELQGNLEAHCIPEGVFDNYDEFLKERRKLIVNKIRHYYFSL
ncbi:hypothetical protein C6499_20110 [Candidatus Poribacteria bacterium]|nr:MAG: hypothetical protein C6499_20110 [Candidatus Poribacteria bacterium]